MAPTAHGKLWRLEGFDSEKQRKRFEKTLARNGERVGQFIAGKVKETLSTGQVVYRPTPRTSSTTGAQSPLTSAEPATPGAPPRVLTGRLRQSVDFRIARRSGSVGVLVGAFTKYARRLELGMKTSGSFAFIGWLGDAHPYLRPTIHKNRKAIVRLFTKPAKGFKRAKRGK